MGPTRREQPGPGQESVWDYPRPPALERSDEDVRPAPGSSFCEWKGSASYLDVLGGGTTVERAAWTYPTPSADFAEIADHVALYSGRMDEVTVAGEIVRAQPGDFYGGWVTSRIVGPFKGTTGTSFW